MMYDINKLAPVTPSIEAQETLDHFISKLVDHQLDDHKTDLQHALCTAQLARAIALLAYTIGVSERAGVNDSRLN